MTDKEIYYLIVGSYGYQTTVGDIDKEKVRKAANGEPSVRPAAKLAKAAWYLAKRFAVVTPPPPPPPPTQNVAPRTHNSAAGADARFCVHSPGVTKLSHDHYTDASGATYSENGLCKNGVRSNYQVPGLKGANSMDGKEPCAGYGAYPPWPAESYIL